VQQIIQHSDKTYFHAVVIFLLWPFLAMVSAFQNYREGWAKNIFWAFCVFYGFVYAIGAETANSDIVRYVARLEMIHAMNLNFQEGVEYFFQTIEIDVLNTFISVSLAFFTDSQVVLTIVYGTIFGFFFSRNIWYILERLEGRLLVITTVLLVCFFLINPIWNITGFRMWTAAHIFIYGLLPYLFENKKYGLWVSASSILVHFSFMVPVMLLFAYMVFGNRMVFYFSFFFITIFISEINIETFNNAIESYAPEVLQERTDSYRTDSQVEGFRSGEGDENLNWYVVWYGKLFGWSVQGFLILMFITGREYFREHPAWMNLFCFTLLFYGAANLLSSLPSGGRFITVVQLCALSLIILYVQNIKREKWMKRFIYFALPGLLLFIVVGIRKAIYTVSVSAILGNPVIGMFTIGNNISLNDVLRMFL
jgi:hypothetical protein